jgi:uncharacterized protein (TIGR04255 family)
MGNFDSIYYKNNFLTNVIFRLDFAPILKISTESLAEFQEIIRPEFPEFETNDLITVKAEIKSNKDSFERDISKLFIFKDPKGSKKIEISNKHLAVVFNKYSNFEDFQKNLEVAFDKLNSEFAPLIRRIGLRFINNIKINKGSPFDWKDYITESLLANLNGEIIEEEKLSRIITQLIYKEDEFNMNFNYGIFNVEYPAKISRKEFLLDYDCYTEDPNPNDIKRLASVFHGEIQSLFEKSIKEKLREVMNER